MFTLVLKGNVVSAINTSAMVTDTTVNPFACLDTKILHVANTSTVAATFIGTNTVVTFASANPIKSTYTFSYDCSRNGKPHFGLDPSRSTGGRPGVYGGLAILVGGTVGNRLGARSPVGGRR
jgi:hypothetical protein